MKFNTTILFLALALPALVARSQNYVTLYEDCNYGGRSYTLEAGNYRSYQMRIDNDRLSSIQVPYGMKVTIYMDDNYSGTAKTFTSNISCLDNQLNDNTSSIVVESTLGPGVQYSQSDFVTFYADAYSKGYSQSLRPGSYTGAQLGQLKNNISSFSISGNLQVKVYVNSENMSGYNTVYTTSQNYLPSSHNDKISSLIIEYRPTTPVYNNGNTGTGSGGYATFFSECNYEGNALRLMPGYYSGEKLGVLKYNIASVQIPSNLRIKAFTNSDNLYGASTEITSNSTCLDYSLKNKIGSLVVEERSGYGYNNNNNQGSEVVVIYTDDNYRGQSATLLPGTYSTMAQCNGFPDNAISSLQVPAGYTVILYEHENFGGKSYTVSANKSGFSFSGWNDRTSSIKVFRN